MKTFIFVSSRKTEPTESRAWGATCSSQVSRTSELMTLEGSEASNTGGVWKIGECQLMEGTDETNNLQPLVIIIIIHVFVSLHSSFIHVTPPLLHCLTYCSTLCHYLKRSPSCLSLTSLHLLQQSVHPFSAYIHTILRYSSWSGLFFHSNSLCCYHSYI